MVTVSMNWVHEMSNNREKDLLTLEKAKRNEEMLSKQGYRWIKLSPRLRVFVPCDENGNPTKDGQKKINELKLSQGIK